MHRPGPAAVEDTSPEAGRVQATLVRAAPVGRRLQAAWGLSATVITLARRAIARSMPDAPTRVHDLRFVQLHYGEELAAALGAELTRRDRAGNQRG